MYDYVEDEFNPNDPVERTQANKVLQGYINNGSVWSFEGAAGRAAMDAISNGECVLGFVGRRDYYGNYIPSRYEVKSGTKGSVAYARKLQGDYNTNRIVKVK